jgi:hypothetical protein
LRKILWVCAALLPAVLGGCARLNRDVAQFDHLAGCPSETTATLAARQAQLGPLTPTHDLQCALEFLRDTRDPALLKTSLGSRLCLHLAERDPDPDQRVKLATEGVRFSDEALVLGGEGKGAVHYYLAANLGLAARDDMALALQSLPRLEREMKRAVELSPELDDGGPLRLLGMLYLKAPPWPNGIGDGDKALDLLKRALEKYPGHPLNHLFYAQALWEVEGDGAAGQVRAELAVGMRLLSEGNWGYNKEPWRREFSEVQKEVGEVDEAGSAGSAPLSAL